MELELSELCVPIVPESVQPNCARDMLLREAGLKVHKDFTVYGTGSVAANVLQLTGSVVVLNQWAEIIAVRTLNNLTNAYATLWDGANSINLTADGLTLSGAPVGSLFTKDKTSEQPYSANIADQCRMLETLANKRVGRPFIITQKAGANTYIRFHFTTTDDPVDFDMHICFEFYPLRNGDLAFL